MAEVEFLIQPSGGILAGASASSYDEADDPANTAPYCQNIDYGYVGQSYEYHQYAAPTKTFWFTFRSVLPFDTKSYSEYGRLESAKLKIKICNQYGNASDRNFDMKLYASSGTTGVAIDMPDNILNVADDWVTSCPYLVSATDCMQFSADTWAELDVPIGLLNDDGMTTFRLAGSTEEDDESLGGGTTNVAELLTFYNLYNVDENDRPRLVLAFSDLNLNLGWLRRIDMSFIKFVQDAVATSDISSVAVIDGYPERYEDISTKLPIITIQHARVDHVPAGLGEGTYIKKVPYVIDVFANSTGQRDDIVDWLAENILHRRFTVWDFNYSIANPDELGKTSISELTNVFLQPMEIYPGRVDKYHALLSFDTETVVSF